MALTKETKTDKIETVAVKDHYVLQCRQRISVMENGSEISASFHRYILFPDADTKTDKDGNTELSKINDQVVLSQFNAVMTDKIKQNYQTFLASQQPEVTEESSE
tara:strand:+ start:158 stop:472 length:315 start_codon:yes stop_codon:yes gene_type:complete